MVALMNEGGFDLVTASGDASLRLIAGKRVQEINTGLIPSWGTVDARLQDAPWHTVDGKHYGVPYQWGSNHAVPHRLVLGDHADVLHRHFVTGKGHETGAVPTVALVQRRAG
jgi:putative spermidine/putrescine transport system substrate-binding protein